MSIVRIEPGGGMLTERFALDLLLHQLLAKPPVFAFHRFFFKSLFLQIRQSNNNDDSNDMDKESSEKPTDGGSAFRMGDGSRNRATTDQNYEPCHIDWYC